MKKKIIALILAGLMVMACVPSIFAANNDKASDAKYVWIKGGTTVYKGKSEDSESTPISLPHYVKVEKEDDEWMEFSWTDILGGFALHGYKYVKVENTSEEEPTDEPDIPEDEVLDVVETVTYEGSTETASVNISAVKGAFPEGTTVEIEDTTVDEDTLEDAVVEYCSDSVLGFFALDITFTGNAQPTSNVVLSINFPDSKVPEGANKVLIVHFGEKVEVVGERYLYEDAESHSISVGVSGFSSYAAVFVNGKYSSQKMSDVLKDNSRYTIAEFPVDIFNYDPVGINTALDRVVSDDETVHNGFHFTGYGVTGCGSNHGINNSSAAFAKQGILEDTLVGGLPVIKYLDDERIIEPEDKVNGITTGKILFSDTEYGAENVKTIYNDIPFEFIYDKNTGYYVYKSSANHAQINEDGTKVELYADTLSTQNQYIEWNDGTLTYCVDSNQKDYVGDFAGIEKASTVSKNGNNVSFKANVLDSNSSKRLDPWVSFVVNNVDASTVGQIYVKAKIPASVGANEFRIYFTRSDATGWDEAKTLGKIKYTANGDYIEFLADTTENAEWNGTITGIRIDLFDTSNVDMITQSYPIEISQISFIKKNYNEYATRGGYYPFSEIEDSYPGNNTAFNMASWETVINDDKPTNYTASRAIYNPAPNPSTEIYNELAYGTVMEFDFYIPVSHQVNDKDLTYYFSGDDDLWVFVDNQLVLDIGGGHGAIIGNVNFRTGKWEVENAVTIDGYNHGVPTKVDEKGNTVVDEDGGEPVSGTIDENLFAAGKHTMKIFYLERGGSVSNCFMKFNLPQTPTGSVEVTKAVKVVDDSNNEVASPYMGILEKEVFEFTIETQDVGANSQEISPTPYVGKCYVTSGGKTEDVDITDGKFTLKDGERASFIINENYEVTVTEAEHVVDKYEYVSTTVNNAERYSATETTAKDETKTFAFVNTYKEAIGDLTITKNGVDLLDHDDWTAECAEETQSTVYTVVGDDVSLTVAIHGNDSITIRDLPVGEYTVTELSDWSWRYDGVKVAEKDNAAKESDAITIKVTVTGNSVTFTNTRTEEKWLSGDSFARNLWGSGATGIVDNKAE